MKVTNNPNVAVNYINKNDEKVKKDIEKLANPAQIQEFANVLLEDALQTSADTAMQEIANFHDAIGFSQIADGALSGISDNLSQIKELQVRANNATLNSDNIAAINEQINKLAENINKTIETTTYNGKSIFGNFNFNGVELNTTMPSFDLDKMDLFEDALKNARSSIGALHNSLNDKIDNLDTFVVNTLNATHPQDIAKDAMDLKNNNIKLNASILASAHQKELYSKVATLLS